MMNIQITMTHEDGHTNVQIRKPENVNRTIELAKACGYVKFEVVATEKQGKSGQ